MGGRGPESVSYTHLDVYKRQLLDEGPEPEEGQLKALQTSRTKIEYTVPDLAERLEQSQGQEPQMNL